MQYIHTLGLANGTTGAEVHLPCPRAPWWPRDGRAPCISQTRVSISPPRTCLQTADVKITYHYGTTEYGFKLNIWWVSCPLCFIHFVLVSILAERFGSCAQILPFTSRMIIRHIKIREWPFDSFNDGNENQNKVRPFGEAWNHYKWKQVELRATYSSQCHR